MKFTVFAAMVLVALFATGEAQSSTATAVVPQHSLSRQEAERLVYSASTPDDHRKLAEYYRQEADRQRKKEQYYLDTAASYRFHPPHADAYRNSPTASLYQELADSARQLAFADELLAQYQDRLARQLESSR